MKNSNPANNPFTIVPVIFNDNSLSTIVASFGIYLISCLSTIVKLNNTNNTDTINDFFISSNEK